MRERTYPVPEVFGPTVQGEGPAQGQQVWFVRLGGCDYRCSWCDTMYAVEPSEVRKAPRLTAQNIANRLGALDMPNGGTVVLSGGNPALHDLGSLLGLLPEVQWHVETQGTRFRPWLNNCQLVVVSPKPPSADMDPKRGLGLAKAFVSKLTAPWALKLVAFDEKDLDWAVQARAHLIGSAAVPCYLSAGTDQHAKDLATAAVLGYRWLANRHVERPDLAQFRVGLQQHVLAWPGELGR